MSAARKLVVVVVEGHADSLWPDVAALQERAITVAAVVVLHFLPMTWIMTVLVLMRSTSIITRHHS
jgi:hypothetical protein